VLVYAHLIAGGSPSQRHDLTHVLQVVEVIGQLQFNLVSQLIALVNDIEQFKRVSAEYGLRVPISLLIKRSFPI